MKKLQAKNFITRHQALVLPIFCTLYPVWWVLHGSMTQTINYLWQTTSVTNYPHQILPRKKWRDVPWLVTGTSKFKHMKFADPAMTTQSWLNFLCHVIPMRRVQQGVGSKSMLVNTSSMLILPEQISFFKTPGRVTQPHSPQGSNEELRVSV